MLVVRGPEEYAAIYPKQETSSDCHQSDKQNRIRSDSSRVNRAIEMFVDVGKMLSLKSEGRVVATDNATKDALAAALRRVLQVRQSRL